MPQNKEQTYKNILNTSAVAGYQKGKPFKLVSVSVWLFVYSFLLLYHYHAFGDIKIYKIHTNCIGYNLFKHRKCYVDAHENSEVQDSHCLFAPNLNPVKCYWTYTWPIVLERVSGEESNNDEH